MFKRLEIIGIRVVKNNLFCFADDTALIIMEDSWNAVLDKTEKCLVKIKIQTDHCLLSVNIEKTKFVLLDLNQKNLPNIQKVKIHKVDCQDEIEKTICIKYLGMLMDENLNWKEQFQYVTNKIRNVIYNQYFTK